MRKTLLLAALLAFATPAVAQQFPQTLPPNTVVGRLGISAGPAQAIPISNLSFWTLNSNGSDIHNANAGKVGIGTGTTVPTDTLDVVGSITTRRTLATNMGGTLKIGAGAYQWQLTGNQVNAGDLYLRNPLGADMLSFPQVGGCMGVAVTVSTCGGFTVQVGASAGNASLRIAGGAFVAGQGPYFYMTAAATDLLKLGTDCAIVSSPCVTDIYARGPGATSGRQFNFYDWTGVVINSTLTTTPTKYVSGALAVLTEGANTGVGGNAITAQSNINRGGAFPTAITAVMNVIDTTTGGPGAATWGIFSQCDVKGPNGLAECASVEATAGNTYGAPGTPPIASNPSPTQPYITALKATCGGILTPPGAGSFPCSVGVWVHYYQGNGGWPFLYGMYLTEGVASTTGIHVNATSALSPTTSAEFRNSGSGKALVLRTMGAGVATNKAFDIQNSGGTSVLYVQNDGKLIAANGSQLNSVSTFTLTDPSGFQQAIASNSSPALTALRTLTLNMQNADRTLSMAGSATFGGTFSTASTFSTTGTFSSGGAFSTASTFSTTGTFSSGGNFSTSSTFSVTGALSIGGAFTTAGAVSLPTIAQGDLWYGSATGVKSALAKDTNATRYLSNQGTSNNPSWNQVNLANGVTGNLSVNNLNSGTGASSSTFWRGDGTWTTPAGGGNVTGPGSSTNKVAARFNGTGVTTTGACTLTTTAAVQSDQETATSTTTVVTPGRQQFHPSAVKAWCQWNGATAGTNACTSSYNVANVTNSGGGQYNVNLSTAFSSANYTCNISSANASAAFLVGVSDSGVNSSSLIRVQFYNAAGSGTAPATGWIACYGDQ